MTKWLVNKSKGINQKTGVTLFKCFIRPSLEYCSTVWGEASKTNLDKLDRIQQISLSFACGTPVMTARYQNNLLGKVNSLGKRRDYNKIMSNRRLQRLESKININECSIVLKRKGISFMKEVEISKSEFDRLAPKELKEYMRKFPMSQLICKRPKNEEEKITIDVLKRISSPKKPKN